jgi:excisionase family DNA binding protein
VSEGFSAENGLLGVAEVAEYLGVGEVTIYRWCREGRLPCLKIGKSWRIRREALEDFLRRSERSFTLVGQLRSFLEVPDNVLAIAQNREMMWDLDAAFFRVGEARGGMLVKYQRGDSEESEDELRVELERRELEVARLEDEGRFRLIAESDPLGGRTDELRRLVAEEIGEGRTIWVNFNWEETVDLDAALEQQREITELVEDTGLVVKTTVLEPELDDWPGAMQRRAQVLHAGTIWLSESGVALSRVLPPPVLPTADRSGANPEATL